jgi:hypothetical protein
MSQNEADELLLLSLRRAQISSVPQSLAGITPDALLALVNSLIFAVTSAQSGKPTPSLSIILPVQIAARHKIAATVATSIRDLGFTGDWGANSILYPNERDVRRLLSWFAGKLLKSTSETATEEAGGLPSAIRSAMAAWLVAPPCFTPALSIGRDGVSVLDAFERTLSGGFVDLTLQGKDSSLPVASVRGERFKEVGAALAAALHAGAADALASSTLRYPGHSIAAVAARAGLKDPESVNAAVLPLAAAAEACGRGKGRTNRSALMKIGQTDPALYAKQIALGRMVFAGRILGSLRSSFARTANFAVAAPHGGANPVLNGASSVATAGTAGMGMGAKTDEEVQSEREVELSQLQISVDSTEVAIKELSGAHANLLESLPVLRLQLQLAQDVLVVSLSLWTFLSLVCVYPVCLQSNSSRPSFLNLLHLASFREFQNMERGYLARRACLDMLPEAPAHLARLAATIEEHTATLLALSQQWDEVRLPLLAAIHERLMLLDAQEAGFITRTAATQSLQADLSLLLGDGRAKQKQLRVLQGEWEAVQAGLATDGSMQSSSSNSVAGTIAAVSRSAYTRRVMDVVRSIRKQKAEIGKIVHDVRSVQQDINGISERLGRTSKSAMTTFEKAAIEQQQNGKDKGDATCLQVLRQAVTLQEAFQRLIAVNGAIGHTDNEIRDLEGRIESMAQRNDARNMSALRGDLAAFAAENSRMEEQLKQLGVSVPPASVGV